ncbi:MAG: hypothetical protein II980_04530 [Clostridia bacterium]|nr:hypothetical protein [Clostridia bacterium]
MLHSNAYSKDANVEKWLIHIKDQHKLFMKGKNKMKKAFTSFFILIVMCIGIISCTTKIHYSIEEQLEKYDFEIDNYNDSEIAAIKKDIENFGIKLNGEINKVTHYVKSGSTQSNTYVYIIQFELKSDADNFYENYAKFYKSKQNDKIVVFGNFSGIDELEF